MVTSWPDLTSSPAAVRPRGPGADDGDLPAAGGSGRPVCRRRRPLLPRPVGDKPFEVPDGHGRALHAADALDLALRLLRADAAGHRRERVVAEEAFRGGGKVAFRDEADEAGDVHHDRAAFHASGLLALDAALGLDHGDLLGESEIHLLEVAVAIGCILLGHRLAREGQAFFHGEL